MNAIVGNSTVFSARRRNLLLVAVAVLGFFLLAVGANGIRIGDVGVSLWAVFGILLSVAFIRQLRLEQSILKNPSEACATVFRLWPTGRRRGFRMKYEFLAGDGKRYIGSAAAPYPLPSEGQTVAVIYRSDQPVHNLPRQQLWFHELQSSS